MSPKHYSENTLPKVTIGLPVSNGADYIELALQSLLSQSFTDFELIISDNGSQDATPEICAHYAQLDPRITYFREEKNRGASWNYNRLVAEAKGEYFKWASHDDLCAPEFLARCVQAMDSCSDIVLCFAYSNFIDADGANIGLYFDRLGINQTYPHQRIGRLARKLRYCNSIFGLIRLSELKKTELIGIYLSSDITLLTELALLGKFYQVEEFLFYRRMHEKMSMVANKNKSDLRAWFDPSQRNVKDYNVRRRVHKEKYKAVLRSEIGLHHKVMCLFTIFVHRYIYGIYLAYRKLKTIYARRRIKTNYI
jgi:glycosyltransferase involved in cell wall biosynthesis